MITNRERSIIRSFIAKEAFNPIITDYYWEYMNEFAKGKCNFNDISTLAEQEYEAQARLFQDKIDILLSKKLPNKIKREEYLDAIDGEYWEYWDRFEQQQKRKQLLEKIKKVKEE